MVKVAGQELSCPFSTDTGTLATTAVFGLAHSAAMIVAPKKISDKLLENPKDVACLHAATRVAGVMAGAGAIAALALSQKDDTGVIRRATLTAQGLGMLGTAAIQAHETREGRNKEKLGWTVAAVHGGIGAICLYRGLKEGLGK